MSKKITLNIQGMHCASCATIIERSLKKSKGVNSAIVNFATKKASVEYDEKLTNAKDFELVIESKGYSVAKSELTLHVDGMNSEHCAGIVKSALMKLQGVSQVKTSSVDGKAIISYDESQLKAEEIIQAIDKVGYKSKKVDVDTEQQARAKETSELKTKLILAAIFTIPFVYFMLMLAFNLPIPMFIERNEPLIQTLLIVPVIYAGRMFYVAGFKSLFRLSPNMDSLVAVGTGAAIFYSFLVVLFPNMFQGLYYEVAAILITFILFGRYLEAITKGKTSQAIKKLIGLQAKTATVLRKGKELKIPIEEVVVNDIILIKPGEKIPTDGLVIEGDSYVDESMVTGESIPVEKSKGSEVIGSTINKNGMLKVKATRIGKDTFLSQVINLVEEAQASKAPIQALVDKISFYFVPIVMIIALFAFIIWLVTGQTVVFALGVGIAVLVIACPCAMGLATPTAVMMGTGIGASRGILIKNAGALQKTQNIDAVVFDKTGTLTKGKPEVTDVVSLSNYSDKDILKISSIAEKNSEHPLGDAIVKKTHQEKIQIPESKSFKAHPGMGVTASYKNKLIIHGNRKLMKQFKIDTKKAEGTLTKLEQEGKTAMLIAYDKKLIGIIAVADQPKENSLEAIQSLHKMGKKILMITGDNERTARAIASQLNIDGVLAEVMPDEKAMKIKELQEKGMKVAMVGDGINDAPALAQADIGIALGSGTDVAIETGEIILVRNDLTDVITAIKLSSSTMKKIKQNLFWAFFYNAVGIPIAAGLLYPFTGWLLSPIIAGGAMALSSVSVVGNTILLRYKKL